MHPSQTYPSDLTDDEWNIIKPLIAEAKKGGRPIEHSRRMILNAIFFVNRSGCQWSTAAARNLLSRPPHWAVRTGIGGGE